MFAELVPIFTASYDIIRDDDISFQDGSAEEEWTSEAMPDETKIRQDALTDIQYKVLNVVGCIK